MNTIIYNRWGRIVYKTENYNNKWNGIDMAGNKVASGVYFFIMNWNKYSPYDIKKNYFEIPKTEKFETNIVLFDTISATAEEVLATLEADGVRLVPFGPRTIRATFHRDVNDEALEHARQVFISHFA